ncbi:MAG: hypothetical protein ABIT58_08190 [Ferruginibacter sp.]
MARSVKKVAAAKKSAAKKTSKKATSKNAESKKSAPAKSSSKKAMPKKAMPAKTVMNKKAGAKDVVEKIPVKKKGSKIATASKAPLKKTAVKKIAIKNKTKTQPQPGKISKVNDRSKKQENNTASSFLNKDEKVLIKDENDILNMSSDTDEAMAMSSHAVPAPPEKYARPADPFHGNTAPVKRKSNINPAGKKPLWNK